MGRGNGARSSIECSTPRRAATGCPSAPGRRRRGAHFEGHAVDPTSSAIVRAGGLEGSTTLFRNDLAVLADATNTVPNNPHTFLTNIGNPAMVPLALAGQTQIAEFFKSNGSVVIDPDGAGPLYETPIALPLPETLNFIN